MKAVMLVCLLGLFSFSFAQSDTSKTNAVVAQRAIILDQVAAAAKEVGVAEKQITKLKAVFETLFKKQDEIKADLTLQGAARQEKLKEANAEKDWKVKDLLGDKLKEYSEARKRIMAEAATKKQ